jgi:hypothetical protein
MELVNRVREVGLAETTAAALWPAEAVACVMADVREAAETERWREVKGFSRKVFLRQLEPTAQGADAMAECARVIQPMAEAYIGGPAYLMRTDAYHTRPAISGVRRRSQKWHRDVEATRVFKAFLYVSDVDAQCGPFEYVLGSNFRRGACPARSYAAPDATFEAHACVGPSGTAFLVDTGGIHRGGFSTGGERLHVMWTWLPGKKERDV